MNSASAAPERKPAFIILSGWRTADASLDKLFEARSGAPGQERASLSVFHNIVRPAAGIRLAGLCSPAIQLHTNNMFGLRKDLKDTALVQRVSLVSGISRNDFLSFNCWLYNGDEPQVLCRLATFVILSTTSNTFCGLVRKSEREWEPVCGVLIYHAQRESYVFNSDPVAMPVKEKPLELSLGKRFEKSIYDHARNETDAHEQSREQHFERR